MDFDFDPDQQDLVAAVGTLLQRHAGPGRAREITDAAGLDRPLMEALVGGGFADVAASGAGPLEAVLVAELVAGAGGRIPFATRALVAPALLGAPLPATIAVLDGAADAPVRFAQHAELLLAPRGSTVVCIDPADVEIVPVASPFGFPQAIVSGAEAVGTPIPGAQAATLARWRHVALAAEIVGCMDAALTLTASYVSGRRAFGHPLGALQGIQHRLAELYVAIEGARWLTRQAAFEGAPAEDAANACTAAVRAAEHVVRDTHQVTGAMGLTREYDLYLWTMALGALAQEAGGLAAHREAVAAARWPPDGVDGQASRAVTSRWSIEDGGGSSVAAMT